MLFPIGIQSFDKIRNDGYVYVDKTAQIYQLTINGNYYFLSRPRRFGKSLLLSTMEAYFLGQKELFKGLAMEQLEKEWNTYPVLHLDLNQGNYQNPDELDKVLNDALCGWEQIYGSSPSEETLGLRFAGIVKRAFAQTGQQVVILIDEYDKPLLQVIDNDALQDTYRSILKSFYSVLKSQDRYIRFAFLTGVTKFSKVSIFSDLNNLKDISMDARYADICGISETELHRYFDEQIAQLAVTLKVDKAACYQLLQQNYDGYHFEHDTPGMYNPFSLLNALDSQAIKSYWYETGTPTYLLKLLKQSDYNLPTLVGERARADVLNSIDTSSQRPIPVLYQSGYLTIKGYDERFKKYQLGFPNSEVEEGFLNYLWPNYAPLKRDHTEFDIEEFVHLVEDGKAEEFMQLLQTFYAAADYRVAGDMEIYFQNTLFLLFRIMGFYVQVEYPTSQGRIDVIIKTTDYIYIIECKLDGSADEALQQIITNNYAAPFAGDPRPLFRIGVNFSTKTRGVEKWVIG
jgi:hypothetical protein